jgi:hypothetical protein
VKAIALILALVFFVIGILYWMGTINFFTRSGTGHEHHTTHLIVSWALAFLCLIWARFQSNAPARH